MPQTQRQFVLPLPHRTATGREDFLVTPSNQEAVTWLDQWPNWPGRVLIIHGSAGCGKSHLAKVWQTQSRAEIMAATALPALDLAKMPSHLAIENLEQITGNNLAEQNLFHLINMTREQSGTLLLTASKAATQLTITLPDLRSRLLAAHAVALQVPDDQLLVGMLLKQFNDRQLQVGQDVLDYLLTRIERKAETIAAIVAALDQAALAENRAITIPLARQTLERFSA
jgi:DnaA regulatory inactivator Hda